MEFPVPDAKMGKISETFKIYKKQISSHLQLQQFISKRRKIDFRLRK